ncbi:MAG: hypothetical protein RMI90_01615, partial [Thermoguttaceae bacterium]|nr:hypothetical protein [Thermoguttaceae bacterium]
LAPLAATLFPPPGGATAQDLSTLATQNLHRPLEKEDWVPPFQTTSKLWPGTVERVSAVWGGCVAHAGRSCFSFSVSLGL